MKSVWERRKGRKWVRFDIATAKRYVDVVAQCPSVPVMDWTNKQINVALYFFSEDSKPPPPREGARCLFGISGMC